MAKPNGTRRAATERAGASATFFCVKCGAVRVQLERAEDVYRKLDQHTKTPGHRVAFVVVSEEGD
jgi:hypothetical protein